MIEGKLNRVAGVGQGVGLLAAGVVTVCVCAPVAPTLAHAWVPGAAGKIAYASNESQPGDSPAASGYTPGDHTQQQQILRLLHAPG